MTWDELQQRIQQSPLFSQLLPPYRLFYKNTKAEVTELNMLQNDDQLFVRPTDDHGLAQALFCINQHQQQAHHQQETSTKTDDVNSGTEGGETPNNSNAVDVIKSAIEFLQKDLSIYNLTEFLIADDIDLFNAPVTVVELLNR